MKKEIFIGYARISKTSQNIERQIENLNKYNENIIIFQEAFSSKTLERTEFIKMLKLAEKELSKNNKVNIVFDSVSRMSRDEIEGSKLYFELEEKGIDLIFLKDGQYYFVDYKTDAFNKRRGMTDEEVGIQLHDKYKIQMKYYKEALEKITESRVKEIYLYLFALDKEVVLEI